jgi:hypothetical protein
MFVAHLGKDSLGNLIKFSFFREKKQLFLICLILKYFDLHQIKVLTIVSYKIDLIGSRKNDSVFLFNQLVF